MSTDDDVETETGGAQAPICLGLAAVRGWHGKDGCSSPTKAVSKHAAGIFGQLDLAPSDDDNRRVLAVLAYLGS